MKNLFLSLALMTISILTSAQNWGGNRGGNNNQAMNALQQRNWNQQAILTGNVYLTDDDTGQQPGAGVTVIVVSDRGENEKKDTTFAVSGANGTFTIRNLRPGNAQVTFSMLGYKEQTNSITLVSGQNRVIANLNAENILLEGAVVRDIANPVSIKEDTIAFHAAAVKLNAGEMAIDILEQMPGVEVTDNGVTVLNEDVSTVYIDGALLFGDAPMAALNNLRAEEVVTIKSYQEYENKDPRHKISKNESKRRVLDIETKTKPNMVTNGNFLIGGGYDTDTTFHKFRYTVGGDINFSSEKLQMEGSFNLNNINNRNNRRRGNTFRSAGGGGSADLKAQMASVSINRRWMSSEARNFVLGSIGASYEYNSRYNVSESRSERIYFPNDQYYYRRNATSSLSTTDNGSHRFSVNARKALADGQVRVNATLNLTDNGSTSISSDYNYQDDLPRQGSSSSTIRNTDGISYNIGGNINKGFNNKFRLAGSMSINNSKNEGISTKVDTTTSTITVTVLDIDTGTESRSMNAQASAAYELSERSTIGIAYGYSNNKSNTVQWAYDVTNPAASVIDSVNTYNRINDNYTNTVSATFRTTFANDEVILSANLDYRMTGLNRGDAFPEEEPIYSRTFSAFIPTLQIGNNSQMNHWQFNWSTSTNTPSIDQLRPRVDNSNLYSISAGNPDLKASKSNAFRFNYSTVLGKAARNALLGQSLDGNRQGGGWGINSNLTTFSINGSFSAGKDPIVSRRTYYAKETYLPKYNYTVPAQASFTSYENASSNYNANLSVNFGFPIKAIGCIFNTGINGSWDKSPSYVNDGLIYTQNMRPGLSLGIRSNFSRDIRFNINGNGSYVRSWNSSGSSTEYFSEAIRAGFELNNLFKVMYLGGNYTKTFMQGVEYAAVNDNILDLNGGFRFGPRNNVELSFTVHDLFNKTMGFSTSMTDDYVNNRWTHNFGRYVMLTLAYRFNSMGGGTGGGPGGPGGPRGGRGGFGGPGGGRGGFGGPGGGGPGRFR
ncbi:MAG: TonB-dependent receptor [Bacteroidales bacterium]|nr:TonB-dependent receptor [Bacteroidales bacterium]